jgi:hypothetical protein
MQCVGHWDYFGFYMVWTRHFLGRTAYRVITYTTCAPEAVASYEVVDARHH